MWVLPRHLPEVTTAWSLHSLGPETPFRHNEGTEKLQTHGQGRVELTEHSDGEAAEFQGHGAFPGYSEQGGGLTTQINKEPGVMEYSWIKKAGWADLSRNVLCGGAVQRLYTPGKESYGGHFLLTLSACPCGPRGSLAIPLSVTWRRLCDSRWHGGRSHAHANNARSLYPCTHFVPVQTQQLSDASSPSAKGGTSCPLSPTPWDLKLTENISGELDPQLRTWLFWGPKFGSHIGWVTASCDLQGIFWSPHGTDRHIYTHIKTHSLKKT